MMKKAFLIFILTGLFGFGQLLAQGAFEEGDRTFTGGLSLGGYGYGYFGSRSSSFLPLLASLEFGVHRYFSLGPYLGYHSYRYSYDWVGNSYHINYFTFGAKGGFHFTGLMNENLETEIPADKFDLYANLYLGLQIRSDNYEGVGNLDTGVHTNSGVTIGGRYMLNPTLGGFLELGYGAVGVFTFGVAVKF